MKRIMSIFIVFSIITLIFSTINFADKDIIITLVEANGNKIEEKALTEKEINLDSDAYTEINYNLNYRESHNFHQDTIKAKGPELKKIIELAGYNFEDISAIKFRSGDNISDEYPKEYLISDRYYYKDNNSTKIQVPTILSTSDNFLKSEVNNENTFTLLFGLNDEDKDEENKEKFIKNITGIELKKKGNVPQQITITGDINQNRELTLGPKDTNGKQLTVIFNDENDDRRIIWMSSDPKKVKVDRFGKLTYISEGEVIITAQSYLNKEVKDSIIVNKKNQNNNLPPNDSFDPDDINATIIPLEIVNNNSSNNNHNNSSNNNANSTPNVNDSSNYSNSNSNNNARNRNSLMNKTNNNNRGTKNSRNSSSRTTTNAKRDTESSSFRDKEDDDSNLDSSRGSLRERSEEFDEFYDSAGSKWRVFEVEHTEKEMPKLNLSGKLDPKAIIMMLVILAIGGVQKYVRYLDSI